MRLSDHELNAHHGGRTAYVAAMREALAKLEHAIAAGFGDETKLGGLALQAAQAYRVAILENTDQTTGV